MQSLDEAYDRRVGSRESRERLLAGYALVAAGGFLVFAGGVVGVSSTVGELFGITVAWERWGVGALLAGVGLPAAFTGIFAVAPMSRRERAIAAAGVAVTLAGVLLFDYAYPSMWQGNNPDLSGLVFLVYTAGSAVMFYSLFRSVLEVEVGLPHSKLSLKFVEENVERSYSPVEAPEKEDFNGGTGGIGVAFDVEGGTDAELLNPDDDYSRPDPVDGFAGDRYCGNCRFYDFVDTDEGSSVPYCSHHDEALVDLEACDSHERRVAGGVEAEH